MRVLEDDPKSKKIRQSVSDKTETTAASSGVMTAVSRALQEEQNGEKQVLRKLRRVPPMTETGLEIDLVPVKHSSSRHMIRRRKAVTQTQDRQEKLPEISPGDKRRSNMAQRNDNQRH